MSNPVFLTGATESKVFDFGASAYSPSASHTQAGISVPASAKTIVTANTVRQVGRTFTVTFNDGSSNLTPIATFNTRRTTSGGALSVIVNVYDVSSSGALTCSQTTVLNSTTSGDSQLLVLLSEGYFQSGSNSAGFGDEYDFAVYNPNAANCSVANIVLSDGQESASLTGVSSPLFTIIDIDGTTGGSPISASCVGSYSDNVFEEYAYASDSGSAKRFQEIQLVFSSQPNPFADIDPRGDIISHDIITN